MLELRLRRARRDITSIRVAHAALGVLTVAFAATAAAQVVTMKYVVVDLGNLTGQDGANVTAWALNESGQVVGQSATAGDATHAFRTGPNRVIAPSDDLGTLGGRDSQSLAVNDRGEIVGQSLVPPDATGNPYNNPRAFLSQGSLVPVKTDLGTLGGTSSTATGINSRAPYDSQVVGTATTAGDAALHAFLWTGNVFNGGTMVDLNTRIAAGTGWELVGGRAINKKGQIVGTAWRNGVRFVGYAVRLDPSDVAADVLRSSLADPAYGLTQGQVNNLGDKLGNAYVSIQQGLFKQAKNQLNSFVNAVQVAVGNGKMSVATGSALVAGANAIIATLG